MADKEVNIILKAIDSATSTIKKVGGDLSTFAKNNEATFKGMAVAGGIAFGAISAFAYKSLTAYQEVERANRQLENSIIGVSKGTKEQVDQVKAITNSLEKKAGIDSDSLNMGVAQLSTFGLQSKSVLALTKSLADLTVNQDGVNATSDNYISSANIMAKAMRGEFGQLQKMGIRFTEHQQELINTGTEAERVAAIQEGFAQNLRETTDSVGGLDVSMAKVRRNMENISEAVGKALAPALNKILEKITPVIEKISARAEKNPELVSKIIIVGGAIAGLVAGIGILGLAIPGIVAGIGAIGTAITIATGPIGIIVAAVGLLAVGMYKLFTGFPTYEQQVATLNDQMKVLDEQYEAGLIPQEEYQTKMGELQTEMTNLEEKSKTFRGYLRNEFASTIDSIKNTPETLGNFFNAIGELFGLLVQSLGTIFNSIGGFFDMLAEKSFAVFNGIGERFYGLVEKGWEYSQMIGDTIQKLVEMIAGIFAKGGEIINLAWKGVWDGVMNMMTTAINRITSKFNALIGVVQSAYNKLKSIYNSAKNFLSGGGSDGARAMGGTVQAGKSYLVGERGPELFTPATTGNINNNPSSSGATININMGGVVVNNEADENRLVEKISQALKRETQLYQLGIN